MDDEEKNRCLIGNPPNQNYYGTFQGVANYSPPFPQQPPHQVFGFPQPIPPPASNSDPRVFPGGYQVVTGYAIGDGRPLIERPLPCCGLGMGWFLFIVGFFLGAIPWYIGAFLALCAHVDYREKPGYIACTIAAVLALIAVTLGVSSGAHTWVFEG